MFCFLILGSFPTLEYKQMEYFMENIILLSPDAPRRRDAQTQAELIFACWQMGNDYELLKQYLKQLVFKKTTH